MQKQYLIAIALVFIATYSSSMNNAIRLSSSLLMQKTFSHTNNVQVHTPQIVFMYLLTQAAKDEQFKKKHLPNIYMHRLGDEYDDHFDWVVTKAMPFSKILDYIPWDGTEHSDRRHTVMLNETKVDVFTQSFSSKSIPPLCFIRFLTYDTNSLMQLDRYHAAREHYEALRHEMAWHE